MSQHKDTMDLDMLSYHPCDGRCRGSWMLKDLTAYFGLVYCRFCFEEVRKETWDECIKNAKAEIFPYSGYHTNWDEVVDTAKRILKRQNKYKNYKEYMYCMECKDMHIRHNGLKKRDYNYVVYHTIISLIITIVSFVNMNIYDGINIFIQFTSMFLFLIFILHFANLIGVIGHHRSGNLIVYEYVKPSDVDWDLIQ